MRCTLVIDSDGNRDTSQDALSAHGAHLPQTLSRHRESRTMDRAACRPGHYTGSEGSIAKGSFSFLSAIDGNYTLYSLVLRGMPGIIALRFCSAIRKTITRNRVPKRIRRPRSIETDAHRVTIDRFTQTRYIYIFLRMLAVTSICGIRDVIVHFSTAPRFK